MLSVVTTKEDQISTFFDLSECPVVLNTPMELNPLTGEITRRKESLNLESVFDEYD